MSGETPKHPKPYLLPLQPLPKDESLGAVRQVRNRFTGSTLGDLDLVVQVTRLKASADPPAVLIAPYHEAGLAGLERSSVRMFRYEPRARTLKPVWNSGISLGFKFVWAKIQEAGIYMPIGLPRDRLLQELLRALARQRALTESTDAKSAHALTMSLFEPFLKSDTDALEALRDLVTRFEIGTSQDLPIAEYNFGMGGHPLPFRLPRGDDLEGFRERVQSLEVSVTGLPEEALFNPPDSRPSGEVPWAAVPERLQYEVFERDLNRLDLDLGIIDIGEIWPWLFSKDWPMYQHDARHSGAASGISSIRATTAGQLAQRFKVDLDGPVNTKLSIVNGKAYVGTTRYSGGGGGTLYKINLCNGCIEGSFPTSGSAYYSISGIGGSPAIYNNKVYFTAVHGKMYCIDATTMTSTLPHPPALWVTDLKNPDPAKNQPISNPSGDCWTSPLVVHDKVYVGSGEGEVATCWGFIWCLDANTGEVVWLFCTNKQQQINAPGNENQPNRIPRSAAISDPLPAWAASFTIMDDPPETGSSPWSSFAYDWVLRRVYVGTGNSQYLGGTASSVAPDQRYGSGLIALDADTGEFRGFHTSQQDDSYWPNDADIDVPGAPTIFRRGGERVVCYGSKNGSFFLLDPNTLEVLGGGSQRRQLLARENGTGHPGNRGNPINSVVPTGGAVAENKWGVMATPAVHVGLGKLYVGLGGYQGANDGTKTPFVRALDWNNLNDAWPTAIGVDGVERYTAAQPPVYISASEAALSSPAVVNDVVFVSTTDPGSNQMSLYALDAATGLCLWAAPKVSGGGWPRYSLGPAISGEYVVAGAGESLYIYTRPTTPWCLKPLPPWIFEWLERRLDWPWPPEQMRRLTE